MQLKTVKSNRVLHYQDTSEKDKGINIKDTGFDHVLLSSHESKTCAYGL